MPSTGRRHADLVPALGCDLSRVYGLIKRIINDELISVQCFISEHFVETRIVFSDILFSFFPKKKKKKS